MGKEYELDEFCTYVKYTKEVIILGYIAVKANLDVSAIALFHTLLKANNEILCEYHAEEILTY